MEVAEVCVRVLTQSCPTLRPHSCSPPGSSVRGILQARILGWVAMPSSRRSSRPKDRTFIFSDSCIAGKDRLFTTSAFWEDHCQLVQA